MQWVSAKGLSAECCLTKSHVVRFIVAVVKIWLLLFVEAILATYDWNCSLYEMAQSCANAIKLFYPLSLLLPQSKLERLSLARILFFFMYVGKNAAY